MTEIILVLGLAVAALLIMYIYETRPVVVPPAHECPMCSIDGMLE